MDIPALKNFHFGYNISQKYGIMTYYYTHMLDDSGGNYGSETPLQRYTERRYRARAARIRRYGAASRAGGENARAGDSQRRAGKRRAVSRDRQGCPGAGEEAGREKSKKESAARKAFPRHVPGRAHRARRRRRRHIHRGRYGAVHCPHRALGAARAAAGRSSLRVHFRLLCEEYPYDRSEHHA